MKTLEDLFLENLSVMYDAEKQITKALPQMIESARSADLQEALESHLAETEGHSLMVEQIFDCFAVKTHGRKCEAVEGMLMEAERLIKDFGHSSALDAAIISAAQKLEHYEIASYGCLYNWSELLGNSEAAELLASILEEETMADAQLNELAMTYSNEEALGDELSTPNY